MSKIDLKLISKIRGLTGAALNTCKRALDEAKGDLEAAVEAIKKMGHAVAAKKANRSTTEGLILTHLLKTEAGTHRAGMIELQCETDFVAKNEGFKAFGEEILRHALTNKLNTLDEVLAFVLPSGQTVEQAKQSLVGQIGENVRLSHYSFMETKAQVSSYVHQGRLGAMVEVEGGSSDIAYSVAVHTVVSRPETLDALLEQEFYKDPSMTVQQYLNAHQAKVLKYAYRELGGVSYSS